MVSLDSLRLPFFIVSLGCFVLVLLGELGTAIHRLLPMEDPGTPPGLGIPYLALLDGLLLFIVILMALPLLLPDRLHAKLQGIATLIVSLLTLLSGIALVIVALALLMIMITLFLAAPFGTLAYLAIYGDFSTTPAQVILNLLLFLKLVGAVCLVLAHQRFLQNKGLVLLILTSLVGNLVIAFLHALVPTPLVSITDAVAGIIVAILAVVWAILLLIGSLPAIVKAVNITRTVG
jgi:hypothetical protein